MTQSRLADYSQIVTAGQLGAALAQGQFVGVFHYLGDDFALREEDPDVVAGVRALGWPQLGIFVPSLARVNGAADAQRALWTYGYPTGSLHGLDIEPNEFAQNPAGWAAAADGWCDAMRAAGLSPGVYGTDETVALCANHADWIWRAKPGMCDPAGPGLDPAFFAGRRAVQCAEEDVAGVTVDVSNAEFSPGGSMAILDEILASAQATQREVGFVTDQQDPNYGKLTPGGFAALVLARLSQSQPAVDPAALAAQLAAPLAAALAADQTFVDGVAAAVVKLEGAKLSA